MSTAVRLDERCGALGLYGLAHAPRSPRVVTLDEAIKIVHELDGGAEGDAGDVDTAGALRPLGDAPPDWLLRPVLGNAWDLPPEEILKQLDGGTLCVCYSAFRRHALEWSAVPLPQIQAPK